MSDLLHSLLHFLAERVMSALTSLLDWMPGSRLEAMHPAWAWLAAVLLVMAFAALGVAVSTTFAWAFPTFIGLLIASLSSLCLGGLRAD